ncbi:beta-trefoil DNA-binding domain-containing protein [Sporodiniella umbellata]|nr:beta-trefoil DNA-binding domain-containing protein [Sporodiniella umbellata]
MLSNESRKRSLNDINNTSSGTNWSDFIYSTPPSPSTEVMFDSHFPYSPLECGSGSNSRRHSVAFGEFDYHTLDLNALSSHVHKRTMSLKEPDFANTMLLESWMLGDSIARPRELSMDSSIVSDFSFSDFSTTDLFNFSPQEMNPTITPSATVTNEINSMANWLLEQPQKRQRLSTDSPFASSSSYSSSPSITPIQPDLGLDLAEQDPASLQLMVQNYLLGKTISGERTIMLLTSKVAQKSYGTEKRFLCPPPATVLKGNHWLVSDAAITSTATTDQPLFQSPSSAPVAPKLTIQISGEAIQQSGTIEWQTSSGTIVDTTLAATHPDTVGKCISKQLYINDADEKRKRVEVMAKVQLGNGLNLGNFQSKSIKVISKPSKKRQSSKNMELCVHHGTTISLFNRIRSQTVSTKYLGVSTTSDSNNGTCFVSRTGVWDPFVIWIVDTSHKNSSSPRLDHNPHHPSYPAPPAIALQSSSSLAIHYNQPVVLQCVTTGLVSPVMIIRKVDKQSLVLGGRLVSPGEEAKPYGGEEGNEALGDPVSQLHKVAFQIVQDPSFQSVKLPENESYRWQMPLSTHPVTYLACLNEVVGMHKTTSPRHLVPQCQDIAWNEKSKGRNPVDFSGLEGACWIEDVSDAAVWTIVGTDCATYTFWTPDKQIPSTPFPLLHEVSPGKENQLIFKGENLASDIEVWFGDIKALETEHKSQNLIHCTIPNVTSSVTVEHQHHTRKIPLLFVRSSSGTVYKTNFYHSL